MPDITWPSYTHRKERFGHGLVEYRVGVDVGQRVALIHDRHHLLAGTEVIGQAELNRVQQVLDVSLIIQHTVQCMYGVV